jgi:hypothetical protein
MPPYTINTTIHVNRGYSQTEFVVIKEKTSSIYVFNVSVPVTTPRLAASDWMIRAKINPIRITHRS